MLRVCSGLQLVPFIKSAYKYIAVEVIRHLSPKRILNVYSSYLPKCTEFFS